MYSHSENHSEKRSATDPYMVCINCKHFDEIWCNCLLLGFDGIRESPNMRCNYLHVVDGEEKFAFERKPTAQLRAEEAIIHDLLGDDIQRL